MGSEVLEQKDLRLLQASERERERDRERHHSPGERKRKRDRERERERLGFEGIDCRACETGFALMPFRFRFRRR